MNDLTDAAKAEINAAIKIIREDRFERFARERISKLSEPPVKTDPPEGPPTPPAKDPIDPPTDPPKEHSKYWGEILR